MAVSGSTKATVYNKAGVGVRKMGANRWLAALFTLIILFAGIYFYNMSSKTVATFGLLVSLIVAVGFLYSVKAMGDKAEALSKQSPRCPPRSGGRRCCRQPVGGTPGRIFYRA